MPGGLCAYMFIIFKIFNIFCLINHANDWNSEQPLSQTHGTSEMNDSKCFQCNVTKKQEDLL